MLSQVRPHTILQKRLEYVICPWKSGVRLQISAGSQESYRSYRLLGWLKRECTYISNLCRDSKQKKILKLPTVTQVKLPFWWFLHIFIHHPSYCLTHPSWIRAGGHPRWVRSCLHRRRRPWLRVATPLWNVAQLFAALRRSNSAQSAPPGPRSPSNENVPWRGRCWDSKLFMKDELLQWWCFYYMFSFILDVFTSFFKWDFLVVLLCVFECAVDRRQKKRLS